MVDSLNLAPILGNIHCHFDVTRYAVSEPFLALQDLQICGGNIGNFGCWLRLWANKGGHVCTGHSQYRQEI